MPGQRRRPSPGLARAGTTNDNPPSLQIKKAWDSTFCCGGSDSQPLPGQPGRASEAVRSSFSALPPPPRSPQSAPAMLVVRATHPSSASQSHSCTHPNCSCVFRCPPLISVDPVPDLQLQVPARYCTSIYAAITPSTGILMFCLESHIFFRQKSHRSLCVDKVDKAQLCTLPLHSCDRRYADKMRGQDQGIFVYSGLLGFGRLSSIFLPPPSLLLSMCTQI